MRDFAFRFLAICCLAVFSMSMLSSCSGGSSGDGSRELSLRQGSDAANFDCDGSCARQNLSAAEVSRVVQQAIAASQQLGVASTISVVDRVGNVLALYQMPGALPTTTINGQIGAVGGLEGATVPSVLAAVSKAGTGAYLSSQGNAFTTRTASQIVQENFNPGELDQPGGPLFGVQFSQLACSDITKSLGPRPLPLGLSADPGGIPLYKQGDLVGAVGVELDGVYTLDRNVVDFDDLPEERIALAATIGHEAPSDRTANRQFVVGKALRYTDLEYDNLKPLPADLPALDPNAIIPLPPFFDGVIKDGVFFGTPASGVLEGERNGIPSAILVDENGNPRFPSIDGTPLADGSQITAKEVDGLLDSILLTAFRTRAQIRRPLDTAARVSIWVVDTEGIPVGFVRGKDAPVFGIDVALQKARGANFFSSAQAGDMLLAAGFEKYVTQVRGLIGPSALTGNAAFADRALGNMSRPFFPDGINDTGDFGPFSHPFPGNEVPGEPSWSPFNTGIQLDIILGGLLAPLSGVIPESCTSPVFGRRLQNGIQIFPGSVPIYRGGTLIGAIGISGDGVDQDDLIAFYGAGREALDLAGHPDLGDPKLGFNSPPEIRSDQLELSIKNVRLRYVNCPEGPFRGSNEQRVCEGI